jgi:electron transport complex protein RnfE
MIIASAVTCIELLMQAFAYDMFLILGIFLPLITTNCVILGRADGFAARNTLGPAMYDGFIMGVGFACVLIVLGGLRELSGTGALFANMDLLLGPGAANWKIVLFPGYQPFLLAILPPGAFIFTGLIIAAKNLIDGQIQRRQAAHKGKPVKGAKRVRVTGAVS